MSNLLQKIALLVYTQFKIIWILITILLLLGTLYLNRQIAVNHAYEDISRVAGNLSNRLDGFIEDLFQEIYTLPAYNKNFSNCKTEIYPYLERITLNNPKISGLILTDNQHQSICSTISDNQAFLASITHARTLQGPFKITIFDQPVYLVQQKISNYHIGILIVASVLKNVLQTSTKKANSVSIFNNHDKKNIIRIEHDEDQNNWILSKNLDFQLSAAHSPSIFALDKLQSINGLSVIVWANQKTILYHLWYSEILVGLITLFASLILYLLIQNLFSRHYSLNRAMKMALKNDAFYPEYQPLFDQIKGRYMGVEVLLRWQNNQDEIIMPDFFIEAAEKTGLIVPITLQIIEKAFKETKSLLKQYPDFHLGFNLTALHFIDTTFFSAFHALCEHYAIPAQQIMLELTERDLVDANNPVFTNKMHELRVEGFSLAVDDYGTGHASISYLQHFPFNYLKIDKLFVHAIGTRAITESLNDAIISMAKKLHLNIIAEGVETKEQFTYLITNGVRFLQGWYFSKALSIEKLTDLLQESKNESLP